MVFQLLSRQEGWRRENEAKMSVTKSGDPRIQYISDSIRAIPDFPHKGMFLLTLSLHSTVLCTVANAICGFLLLREG